MGTSVPKSRESSIERNAMCGRFTLSTSQEILEDRFRSQFQEDALYKPRYNAAPSQLLPVIFNTEPGCIEMARWGIMPVWWKRKDGLINIRAETLIEKHTFKKDLENRRCLVLADGFYEWQKTEKIKQPYRFTRKDKEPFAFAGIWQSNIIEGEKVDTFSIITTTPNKVTEPIHNRMPVILAAQEEMKWLEQGDIDLLDPFPAEEMEAYKVSAVINSPAKDMQSLIEPLSELNSK